MGGFDVRDAARAMRRDSWVRPHLRTHWKMLAAAVLLSSLAFVFASALMFTSGYMISLAATIPFTVLALHLPSIFVRIFGVGKPVLQYLERLASHDWVLRMTSSLRVRLYDAVERRPAGSSTGRMLGLFADDLENLQNLCLRTLFPMIVVAAMYVVVVVAFGVLSPLMGLAMLAVVGLAAFAVPLWSLSVNAAREACRRKTVSSMYDKAAEDVFGVVDWGLSGRREEFLERLSAPYEAAYAEARARDGFERWMSVLRQALYCVAVVGVFAWAAYAFAGAGAQADGFVVTGAAQALGGVTMHDSMPYPANWIAAFVLCMFPLLDVFSPASEAVLGFAEHKGSLDELNALDADSAGCADGGGVAVAGTPVCQSTENAVELRSVRVSYDGGATCVLDGVDLCVRKGERIAIVGRSGAGKSTLMDVVGGKLAPSSGDVRVSGKVGYIEQFPYVFRKSLRENLLLAKPDATDEELIEALEDIGLLALVERLPDGLDTLMAEGGATLSGGERHRLALARILLFHCDVVLLDEPYLGLDDETRREVSRAMLSALRGKTVLMVTHGMDQALELDEVFRVEGGGVRLLKSRVAGGESCV